MALIDLFTDYVLQRKDLNDYADLRRRMNERGVFDDARLAQAQANLARLRGDSPEIYEAMYRTLEQIYARYRGFSLEYPIEFIHQVLRLYDVHPPERVLRDYRNVLEHYHHDL